MKRLFAWASMPMGDAAFYFLVGFILAFTVDIIRRGMP